MPNQNDHSAQKASHDFEEEEHFQTADFLRCPHCDCEMTYEDWMERGCPNCEAEND